MLALSVESGRTVMKTMKEHCSAPFNDLWLPRNFTKPPSHDVASLREVLSL